MVVRTPGPLKRAALMFRDNAYRVERRLVGRYSDAELRQLRSLERSYGRDRGPEVLLFGDSAMYWTTHQDKDRRHLAEMIRDQLGRPGTTFEVLTGPGYNPRIVMAFLVALERCRARPRVVVVPTSVLMACSIWLAHPGLGYEEMAPELRAIAEGNGERPRRLSTRPGPEADDAYDRLPLPSLFGARRTAGELRLIINSVPGGRWQQVVRLRHMMDFYNAERLTRESEGVELVAELGAMLKRMGLPSVACIPPVNHEVLVKTLGPGAGEHLARNAEVVEQAYLEGAGETGTVVNAVFDCPATEYTDPVHVSTVGRLRYAGRLAEAMRPALDDQPT